MTNREFQFIQFCARSRPNTAAIREAVKTGVNWQKVLELADHHNVRPLLRQSLKSVCWDAVPQSVNLELETFNSTNTKKNLSFAAETLRLVTMFQKQRIPIATFKGV